MACFHAVRSASSEIKERDLSWLEGWTTAFVSPVIDAQSRSPTVMHALLYWLGSALRAPGGFVQPVEVGVQTSSFGMAKPNQLTGRGTCS